MILSFDSVSGKASGSYAVILICRFCSLRIVTILKTMEYRFVLLVLVTSPRKIERHQGLLKYPIVWC